MASEQHLIRDLRIDMAPLTSLTPYDGNARTHSQKQIGQIARSIEMFGWTNPILTASDGRVIAGHGRLAAARQLGIQRVPTLSLSDLNEAQIRAYTLADNKLAENAGWDEELLRLELGFMIDADLGISVEDLGFEIGEVDALFERADENAAPEEIPKPNDAHIISEPGDIWVLGQHRLICGDALKAETYCQLIGGDVVDAVFTDPPYNVPIDGHVCGLGSVKHDEFQMASGEMTDDEFRAFLSTLCRRVSEVSKPGAIAFMCMDWRHIADLIAAGEGAFGDLINLAVWNKNSGGMGSLYRSKHELVGVFRKPGAPHRNNVELGKHGRNRTNVWDYPGVISRRSDLKLHPTVKPTALVADAIKDVTAHGELVLDPFAGSGSTLLAAEQTGRRSACVELEPKYVDLIIRRFREATGIDAHLLSSGMKFSALE